METYIPRSQELNSTCGQTCLANAMALYGIPTSQAEAIGHCGENVKDGADFWTISKAVRKYGFYPVIRMYHRKAHQKLAFEWVKSQTVNGKTVMAHINGFGTEDHAVLILEVRGTKVLVFDPSKEVPFLITKRNLFKAWWNYDVLKEGESPAILLLSWTPRTKTARKAVYLRQSLLSPKPAVLVTEKTRL